MLLHDLDELNHNGLQIWIPGGRGFGLKQLGFKFVNSYHAGDIGAVESRTSQDRSPIHCRLVSGVETGGQEAKERGVSRTWIARKRGGAN